ncbi:MAG: hypothetical protein IPI66_01945 [Chitinophagaceae bacterium]|nr:hypothetical protein [Chitinophagaceae bacterium]
MNMNRHNYETFFLLYVDNELSAPERKAVELFVEENPDLKTELSLLQETVIMPDPIAYSAKADLLKSEDITPLQDKILSYIDHELDPAGLAELQSLVSTDLSARRELDLLSLTKLEPETIVFTDKKSLYRTEGAKVVTIRWWRVAAAAVLLGFGLWAGVTAYRNYLVVAPGAGSQAKNDQPGQNGKNPVQLPATDDKTPDQVPNPSTTNDPLVSNIPVQDPGVKDRPVTARNNRSGDKSTLPANTRPDNGLADNRPVKKDAVKPSNNLPKSYLENINNRERNEITATIVTPKNENSNLTNSGISSNAVAQNKVNAKADNPVIADLNIGKAETKTTTALQAVYNPTASENNNNRYVDLDEERTKRGKIGGLLRKVKRALERNANIKTGDEVKVAGFEIAIK